MRKLLILLLLGVFASLASLSAQCNENIELAVDVQAACRGETGSVDLRIIGGTPPYLINENISVTGDTSLNDLSVGTYSIAVRDIVNCMASIGFTINELAGPSIQNEKIWDASPECLGGIDAEILGDTPSVEIQNESGIVLANSLPATNLIPGNYQLIIRDANRCVLNYNFSINEIAPLQVEVRNIVHATENCGTSGGDFELAVTGGISPYSYQSTPPFNPPLAPGEYTVTVTDAANCSEEVAVNILSEGDCLLRSIYGKVNLDANKNCILESDEIFRPFLPIRIELVKDSLLDSDRIPIPSNTATYIEGLRYEQINTINSYQITIELEQDWAAEYDYKYIKLSTETANECSLSRYISINDLIEGTTTDFQFLVNPSIFCPQLSVDIAAPRLRRGFVNPYYVAYCNNANVAAEDAYIDIVLDAHLIFQSSPLEAEFLGENTYRFDLGTIAAGECGRFTLDVLVSTTSVFGQTHCTEAHIYPDAPCTIPPNWSGAELRIDARCEGDEVIFGLENIGDGTIDAIPSSVVTEEIILLPNPRIDVDSLQDNRLEFSYPANGGTYRFEVEQVPGFPFPSRPSVSIEGCGKKANGTFSTGIINLFPHGDYEPYLSIDCQENSASYDPNDKRGLPLGLKEEHFIMPNVDIEYQIRFQNTGTDTAFNVVLLDTLSAHLDWNKVQIGASSHPYEFDKIGKNVLRFQFRNILLPDSTTNATASQGFVNFRIPQVAAVPRATVIENSTAIYFDFNDAVITETSFHTVNTDFLELFSTPLSDLYSNAVINVQPNPFSTQTKITVSGISKQALSFELYDMNAKLIYIDKMSNNTLLFHRNRLAEGMYIFRLLRKNKVIGISKLIIADN